MWSASIGRSVAGCARFSSDALRFSSHFSHVFIVTCRRHSLPSLAWWDAGGGDVVQATVQGHHARANFVGPGPQGVQEEGGVRARAEGGVRAGAGQQAAQGEAEGEKPALSAAGLTPNHPPPLGVKGQLIMM